MELTKSLPLRETKQYCIAMDNNFTYPKIITEMRKENVACVGTARARRGWPPAEIKEETDERFTSIPFTLALTTSTSASSDGLTTTW